MAKILVEEGAKDLAVGSPLAVLVEDEAHIAAFKDYSPASTQQKPSSKAQPESKGGYPLLPTLGTIPSHRPLQPAGDCWCGGWCTALLTAILSVPSAHPSVGPPRVPAAADSGDKQLSGEQESVQQEQPAPKRSDRIGPAAKKLLQESGLSVDSITPSGPRGIVTKSDVLAAISGGQNPAKQQQQQPDKQLQPDKVSKQGRAAAGCVGLSHRLLHGHRALAVQLQQLVLLPSQLRDLLPGCGASCILLLVLKPMWENKGWSLPLCTGSGAKAPSSIKTRRAAAAAAGI